MPPTKKQETIVRRNKIKCKITLHLVISYCFLISIKLVVSIKNKFLVVSLLCYSHESGVGVGFIRPETGLMNQTPTS